MRASTAATLAQRGKLDDGGSGVTTLMVDLIRGSLVH